MPYYNGGYKDLPDITTPITAEAMNVAEAPKILGGGLLINGNFDVSQRGESFPNPGSARYTIDRIFVGGSVNANRVTNTSPTNSKYAFQTQPLSLGVFPMIVKIENPNNVLYDKKSTLSFWIKGTVATTSDVLLYNATKASTISTKSYNISTSWAKIELTFDASTNWDTDDVIEVYPITNYGAVGTFEISQVKFEVGEVATEFIPNTPAEELRDCDRYALDLLRGMTTVATGSRVLGGYVLSATTALLPYTHLKDMRIPPTVTINNLTIVSPAGISTVTGITSDGVSLTVTTSGVAMVGSQNCQLRLGGTDSVLLLDSEL